MKIIRDFWKRQQEEVMAEKPQKVYDIYDGQYLCQDCRFYTEDRNSADEHESTTGHTVAWPIKKGTSNV